MVVLASLLLFVFMFTGRRLRLDRWESALFLAGYAIFDDIGAVFKKLKMALDLLQSLWHRPV
jgi:hypothetical protein